MRSKRSSGFAVFQRRTRLNGGVRHSVPLGAGLFCMVEASAFAGELYEGGHAVLLTVFEFLILLLIFSLVMLLWSRHCSIHAERILKESEERLRLSTEMAGVAVWEYNVSTDRISRSANHDLLYGLEPLDEWSFETFLNAMLPDDREPVKRVVERAMDRGGEDSFLVDYRVVWPDKSVHWLSVTGEVVRRDRQGKAVLVRGCLIDITRRRQAELALRKSEEQARQLSELVMTSNQPLAIGYPDGRLGRCNPAFCKLTGYSEEELRVIDWSTVLTPPEWLPREQELLSELTKTGQPVRYEKEYIHKDGTRIPIELFAHVVLNVDGTPKYFYAFITDITERKEAYARLKASETRFRALFEQAGDYCMILDPNTPDGIPLIVDANEAAYKLHGYTREEFIGRPVADIDDEDGRKKCLARTRQIMTGKPFHVENRHVRKDGSEFYVAVHANRIDLDDEPSLIFTTEYDITERKIAERALQETQRSLLEAQRIAGLGSWDWNISTDEVLWSDITFSIFGLEPQEISYGLVKSLIHPDDVEEWEAYLKEMLERSCAVFDLDHRIIRPDGSVAWIHSEAEVIRNTRGKPMRMVGTSRDVTEQKEAELKLRESESVLRLVIEQSPLGFTMNDAKGRFLSVNTAFSRMTGYSEEELGKLTLYDISHPDDLAASQELMERLARRESDHLRIEKRYRRKDGTWMAAITHVGTVIDDDGRMLCGLGLVEDITERKRADDALRREKELLNFSLEANRTGAWFVDLSDNSSGRTPGHDRIFGYDTPLEDWSHERFLEHVLPEDREEADRLFREAAEAQGEWSIECRIRRADGEIRWIWDIGRHSDFVDGKARLISGIIRDITERKEQEEKLRKAYEMLEIRVAERTAELKVRTDEAEELNRGMLNVLEDLQQKNRALERAETALKSTNRELEAFSYSVSHDLRAPLRHIAGFVELLVKKETDRLDDRSGHYLATIEQSVRRMGLLIDDLLALSRMSRSDMHLRNFEMKDVVQESLKELTSLTKDRCIVWNLKPMPSVTADPRLIRQVWMNLIGNAVKFTARREEAVIEIGILDKEKTETEDQPVFYIRDNGAGFETEYAHKLFGVFQRLHREDEFEGTGIGLATVRRIIHRHNGRIWAEGAVDQGAAFYFTLGEADGGKHEHEKNIAGGR